WNARDRFGDAIQDMAHELGLGKRTGIALPYEAVGRVPDPETRKRLHDANPKAFPNGKWFSGDNVNLAIGQGELVITPLQLANAPQFAVTVFMEEAGFGASAAAPVARRILEGVAGKPLSPVSFATGGPD